MTGPSTPPSSGPRQRGDGGGFAQSVAFSAARGAVLIGIAVIIGIVLLQVVDDGTTGPIGDGGTSTSKSVATTTTTKAKSTSSTATTGATPAKDPSQVSVQVLNGSGVAGAARTLSDKLKAGGYNTTGVADTASQQGTVVYCTSGLDREAAALAAAVGSEPPATTGAMPSPLPQNGDTSAACIVVVGS